MVSSVRRISSRKQTLELCDLTALVALFSPLLALPRALDPRRRVYTMTRMFWLFLSQVLQGNFSCREAVRGATGWLACRTNLTISANTAAYCRARNRLPVAWLRAVFAKTRAPAAGAPRGLWHGLVVKVVDGTSIRLPDTPENQKSYPQPKTQAPGCGFPVLHLVAIFCLATGCLEHFRTGQLYEQERGMFDSLRSELKSRELVLADRGFCGWAEFFKLRSAGLEVLMRKHQRLDKGLTTVKRLGKNDRIVTWHRSSVPARGYTREEWRALPATMTVREVVVTISEPGLRSEKIILLTTLLDPKRFPAKDLAALYHRRWQVELYFNEIKTSMSMNELHCKSPTMVERELLMYLIGYNLIRLTMLQAAAASGTSLERLSFMGTVSTVHQWAPLFVATKSKRKRKRLWRTMLHYIGKDPVPERPGRREPRVKKRRDGTYPILTKPRHQYVEIRHREKYRKAAASLS